ncbi:2-phospho-L-lactate transferase [Lacisediminihabitans changchengi]|uniref:2-phospho-L-lactate transferase n=1 Tax=Lacisediminihabitans changchengi TaxID=2787634 RepID=A0A934W371_9MICO|nr:2-phospho-L-lactate transferase [Lacisediminihabitans changchengi]MBK4346230.1 2-phospho-L-lactate transferase [Lacisediminihabitans changchengi]
MKITVISGGVGGARFTRGLREHVRRALPGTDVHGADLTAIVNTGDDMWLTSLRIAPDLDSVMYTLAGENDEVRGWGRIGETERVSAELRAYGVGWPWFTLGDLDLGTHITRSHYLRSGLPLSEATRLITARWPLGVELIPATDDEVETHVVTDAGTMHFQEWWTKHRAALTARAFVQKNVDSATPAPGVLDAIASADVVLVAPSNPVVSVGTVLGIPGIREALAATSAPVVGVSPIISGAVVRGMADACLSAIGVETSAFAVAEHYGSRRNGGLLDAWLVNETDAASLPDIEALGIRAAAAPLWMRDADTSAQLAADVLALATAG